MPRLLQRAVLLNMLVVIRLENACDLFQVVAKTSSGWLHMFPIGCAPGTQNQLLCHLFCLASGRQVYTCGDD